MGALTTYQVATATGVSRPAFSPSGQMWTWTPQGVTDYGSLAEAIAAAEAIPPADGLLVQLCRYPAPDPQTAPCIAQRIGRSAWRQDGRDLPDLTAALEHVYQPVPDDVYEHLAMAACSCGWRKVGFCRDWLAGHYFEQHLAEVGAPRG